MSERSLHRFPILILLLAVVVGLGTVACDSGSDSNSIPDIQNEFSFDVNEVSESSEGITASEKAQATLSGFSFFYEGTDPDSDEEIFVMYFTETNDLNEESANEGLFGFVFRESLRPGEGTYPLVFLESDTEAQSDFGMMLFDSVGEFGAEGGVFNWYIADAGSMDLGTSADDRVEGTISAEAMRLSVEGTSSDSTRVTIDGTFTARNAESFVGFSVTP